MQKQIVFLSTLSLFIFGACSSPNVPKALNNIPNPIPTSVPNVFGPKVKKEYFTGGKLRSEFIMSDKTGQNGLLKKYGYDGKLTSTVTIHKGQMHGTETLFDPKGGILKKTPYNYGKKEGTLTAYYPNGDTMATIPYKNDLKHGKAFKYNKDGSINAQATYSHGRLVN
jgi:antitoxin component YwqK of YwqJK toxin-antitoxin module